MQADEKTNTAILCLTHAISDAQGTIRAYDIKAEIFAGFLAIVIGVTNYNFMQQDIYHSKLIIGSWIVGFIAIFLLGMVLHPKKNQFKSLSLGKYTPQEIYYLHNISSSPQNNVDILAKKAIEVDWVTELIYENMKLSVIRDRKDFWFMWALRTSGVTVLLIAASILCH